MTYMDKKEKGYQIAETLANLYREWADTAAHRYDMAYTDWKNADKKLYHRIDAKTRDLVHQLMKIDRIEFEDIIDKFAHYKVYLRDGFKITIQSYIPTMESRPIHIQLI